MSPDSVFTLWTTTDGIRLFLAADGIIEPRVGGQYTIIFNPQLDPAGASEGTLGAHVLRVQRPNLLEFEWTMPPFAARLNSKPLPTSVELTFRTVPGNRAATHVTLVHRGFGTGAEWDKPLAWFRDLQWPTVLRRLVVRDPKEMQAPGAVK